MTLIRSAPFLSFAFLVCKGKSLDQVLFSLKRLRSGHGWPSGGRGVRPVLPCDGLESWELDAAVGCKTEDVHGLWTHGAPPASLGPTPPLPAASPCGNFSLTLESQLKCSFLGDSESSVPSTLQAINTHGLMCLPLDTGHTRLCVSPQHTVTPRRRAGSPE